MELEAIHRAALRRARPLRELQAADFDAFVLFLRSRQIAAGEALFRQGEPGDSLFIVGDGRLTVSIRRDAGVAVEVAEVGPGEVVGEMAIIDPAPRNATVTAREPATAYELSRSNFEALQLQLPGVSSALVGTVIRDVTRRLREVDARIARELVPAGKARSAPSNGGDAAPEQEPTPTDRKRSLWNFLFRLGGSG